MLIVIVLNLLALVFCLALLRGMVPVGFLGSFVNGLHQVIGITTPNERQVRWTLVAWVLSPAAIVDVLFVLLAYVL